MNCILCGAEWPGKSLSFSAVCEKCDCWLHSCIQCALWDSQARMCKSMTTDTIADRQGKNFCEEWKPGSHEKETDARNDSKETFTSLFGE